MLYLYDADKNVVDKVSVPALATDVSYGRDEGRTSFFYYDEATPGAANTTTAYLGVCEEPAFSDEGGVKTSSLKLTLTAPEGSTIYYTTDCSTPTTASTPYTGPISIAENTVVRAIAVRDGYLTSTTATRTYITEDTHTVRVVSLVTDDQVPLLRRDGHVRRRAELAGGAAARQPGRGRQLLDGLGVPRARGGLGGGRHAPDRAGRLL